MNITQNVTTIQDLINELNNEPDKTLVADKSVYVNFDYKWEIGRRISTWGLSDKNKVYIVGESPVCWIISNGRKINKENHKDRTGNTWNTCAEKLKEDEIEQHKFVKKTPAQMYVCPACLEKFDINDSANIKIVPFPRIANYNEVLGVCPFCHEESRIRLDPK